LFELLHLLFAQRVKVVSVLLRHMEAVYHQVSCDILVRIDVFLHGIQVAFPHISGEGADRRA